MEIAQIVEARQVAIGPEEAWRLLSQASAIRVGRGEKETLLVPATSSREEVLAQVLGRSNTLRAPTLKFGSEYLVGYGEEMYRRFFASNRE